MAEKLELKPGAVIDCQVLYPDIDDIAGHYALVQVGEGEPTNESVINAPPAIAGTRLLRGMKLTGVVREDLPPDTTPIPTDVVLQIEGKSQSAQDWVS